MSAVQMHEAHELLGAMLAVLAVALVLVAAVWARPALVMRSSGHHTRRRRAALARALRGCPRPYLRAGVRHPAAARRRDVLDGYGGYA